MAASLSPLEQAIFERLCAAYFQRPNLRYPSRGELHTVAETHQLARVVAGMLSEPTVAAEASHYSLIHQIVQLQAVQDVVRAAVDLVDATTQVDEDGAEVPRLDPESLNTLTATLCTARALLPDPEVATAGHLLTLMMERLLRQARDAE